jgi:hypothetical protein
MSPVPDRRKPLSLAAIYSQTLMTFDLGHCFLSLF